MFRKFVCVFLIVWLSAAPAYAAGTTDSFYQIMPLAAAVSSDVSVSIAPVTYDAATDATNYGNFVSISGSVPDGTSNFGFSTPAASYNSVSPYYGFCIRLSNLSSSSDSIQVVLNNLQIIYNGWDGISEYFYARMSPEQLPIYRSFAYGNWSGSGKYTAPSGQVSWASLSGKVQGDCSLSISDSFIPSAAPYDGQYVGYPTADFNLNVDLDFPETAVLDGSTYEVTSASCTELRLVFIFKTDISDNFVWFGTSSNDSVRKLFPNWRDFNVSFMYRFIYDYGAPAVIVSYWSGGSGTGISSGIQQSIGSLSNKVSQGLSDVKQTVQQGTQEIKQNIAQSTQEIKQTMQQGAQQVTDKLIEVKDDIVQGISDLKDTTTQGFKDVVQGITDLPGKMQEMLTEFIVPDEETVAGKMTDFQSLAEDKLGVIYQVPTMLFDMAEGIISGVSNPQGEMVLPKFEIIMPATNQTRSAETLTVWEEYRFPIWPAGTEVIQTAVQTATSMICVIFTFNALKRKYEEWLDGH